MGDDDARSRSIFAVLGYCYRSSYFCSLVKLTQPQEEDAGLVDVVDAGMVDASVVDVKYFAHFKYTPPREPPYLCWSLVPSSTNDFYLMPYTNDPKNRPLHGATFSLSTKTCQIMEPHIGSNKATNVERIAVKVQQAIYFLAHPNMYDAAVAQEETVFERYIPAEKRWYDEVPFPYDGIQQLGHRAHIEATVVWDDIIIFNMGGKQIWAYHVIKHKWYRVIVGDEKEDGIKVVGDDDTDTDDGDSNYLCYAITGEGFIVKNTIYALSEQNFDSVLALSIEKKKGADGDLQFRCSLRSEIDVKLMMPMEEEGSCCTTRHLVHLGGDNFCLVQSCQFWDQSGYQPIDVTYMKLVGEDKMVVTNILSHRLRTPKDQLHGQFHVEFCFSQPECKTTALNQGETTFFVDPYNGISSKQGERTNFYPEPEVGELFREEKNATLPKDGPPLNDVVSTSVLAAKTKSKARKKSKTKASTISAFNENKRAKASIISACTNENKRAKASTISACTNENKRAKASTISAGYSVMVLNLPFGDTAGPIEKVLKKCGPIKRNGIRLNNISDATEKYCFAVVEFESVAAKGYAIEASPIKIGDCTVDIVEKRMTSLP